MKLKLDFITNSSSTSYIVYVPNDFNIEKFLYLAEDYNDVAAEQFGTTIKKLDQLIKEEMEKLMENGCLAEYCNELEFIVIKQVLRKLDLIINELGIASSNDDIMFNINNKGSIDKIKEIKSGGWGVLYGGWGQTV